MLKSRSEIVNRIAAVAGALLLCSCSGETGDAVATSETSTADDFNYISVSDGRISTVHGVNYEIAAPDSFDATEVKNREDNFDGTPYKISLAALIGKDSALMIHAETVADLSEASDYSNLPESAWPDENFRSRGHVCMEVPPEAIEGEHDLEWLRSNGFNPVGVILLEQFFATTADMNKEIVLSILIKMPACDDEAANKNAISEFQAEVSISKS
ncbi:MAG: hypothetical protein ACR2QL_04345 [Woeseiaceae bacterium]